MNLKVQLSNSDEDANNQVILDTPDVLSVQNESDAEEIMWTTIEHNITLNQDPVVECFPNGLVKDWGYYADIDQN